MTSGLTYPYTKYDRLLGDRLDVDLEFSPAPTPPSGSLGGAGRYKYWVDTTVPANASLRQCIAARATAGVYVPAEWITLGTIDIAAAKFHFNTDQVDFTGGSGSLVVHELTVTGATTLNTLTVTGATNLNTLNVSGATTLNTLGVSGASALHDTGITGALNVTGAITGGSLNTAGAINGATLNISGVSALHDTGVTGSLNVSGALTAGGAITGGSLNTGGNLNVSGVATVGSMPSLHVTGNTGVDGALDVGGSISGASLGISGAITGASLGVTGAITAGTTINAGGVITGASFNTAGAITGGSLGVTGNIVGASLGVSGAITGASATISGPIVASTSVDAEQYRMTQDGTSYMFANMGTDIGAVATLILGPEFEHGSDQSRIAIYNTGQTYNKANEHYFWNTTLPYSTFAVFTSAGTSNVSGSWDVISDDSIKENIVSYTAGLAELLQLDVVSYNYIVPDPVTHAHWSPFGALREGETEPPTHYGMMASDVQAVIPEMVTETSFSNIPEGIPDTPLLTIAPTHLVWILTNAVKTLAAQDNTMLAQIQALDARVTVLETP